MGKVEILRELPNLQPAELAEIQAKLDELTGNDWLDSGELSAADEVALDAGLAAYHKHPNAGSSWEEVQARIQTRLRP